MDLLTLILPIVFVAVFFLVVLMAFISRYLLICHPNEVLVLSGRNRRLADGHRVGYRIIRGGRALRVPLVEKAARLSLETIPLELSVRNAYSKGGIPLQVEAIANVKIDSNEPILGNAVERFLGKPHAEIHEIAKDTLEGNLRGVLATLTPEEVNDDRLKFAGTLVDEADQDLKALGLMLDTLKIQNVSDDAGYLDSLGRRKTAEVLASARTAEAERASEAEEAEAASERRAEVAKAQARREIEAARIEAEREVEITKTRAEQTVAEEQNALRIRRVELERDTVVREKQTRADGEKADAEADREAEVARAQSQTEIEEARNSLRVRKAELEKEAVIREKEAEVAGRKAEAAFEQELEQERIELQRRRLEADVVAPARAKKEAMELEAEGAAASVREQGNARVAVLRQMVEAYLSADGQGERVFMLDMLPQIVRELADTVDRVSIDKVSVIDSGSGGQTGVGRAVTQLPGAVISMAEQIENATGVDILSSFGRRAAERSGTGTGSGTRTDNGTGASDTGASETGRSKAGSGSSAGSPDA